MKKVLLLMASVLLFSCNNSTLLTNGTYKVTSETSLVVNGVDAYYLDYSQAEIVFTGINGNAGTMTLNNIVTGQPSVTMQAELFDVEIEEEDYEEGTSFSGTTTVGDRNVEVNGIVFGESIMELTLSETVTSEIVGQWSVSQVTLAISHPDLDSSEIALPDGTVLKFSDAIALLNVLIAGSVEELQSDYLEFASDGFVKAGSFTEEENQEIMYYVADGTINFYLRASFMTSLASNLGSILVKFPGLEDILDMLGFGDFVLTSSAMTIPVYYTKADNSLVVYINEDLVKAYLDEETVTALLAYVAEMDYQIFYEMIEGSVLDGYVTEENFEGFKNMLLDLMVKLTSDDATYSVTASFVPYTAA